MTRDASTHETTATDSEQDPESRAERAGTPADDGSKRRTFLAALGAGVAGSALHGVDLGAAGSTPPTADAAGSGSHEYHRHEPALELVPRDEATHRARTSGDWNDPATWDRGSVPGNGDRVHVPEGVTVTVTSRESPAQKTVRVDGTLRFDPETATRLRVETMITTPSSVLEIGTRSTPVTGNAELAFADAGPIDESVDPTRVGKGLIAMGKTRIHGRTKTGFEAVADDPTAGDRSLTLATAPTNWSPGDRVVLAGVNPERNEDEEREIAAVDGREVTLERPLEHDHVPPEDDLQTYVANLYRSVRLVSENRKTARRGHVMFTSTAVQVRYAGCYGLGRTDKSYPFTNPEHGTPPSGVPPNPKARYPIHFHHTGTDTSVPARVVQGCAVWDGPGWGVVNHHSYVDVLDCVTYDVLGAGFVAEAGDEVGRFVGNFALRSEGSGEVPDGREFLDRYADREGFVDDFGHSGHGFWLQSPGVAVDGNVAAGHRHMGFVFWTRAVIDRELDPGEEVGRLVGKVPTFPVENVVGQERLKRSDHVEDGKVPSSYVRIRSFADNEVFASAGGVDVSRHMFGNPTFDFADYATIRDFTVWNPGSFVNEDGRTIAPDEFAGQGGNAGITIRYSNNVVVLNGRLAGRGTGVGFNRNFEYGNLYVRDTVVYDWQTGVRAAPYGLCQIQSCGLANPVNVEVAGDVALQGGPAQDVRLNDVDFLRGSEAHVRLRTDSYYALYGLFAGGGSVTLDGRRVYFESQAPDHVPIPDRATLERYQRRRLGPLTDAAPGQLVGKTNRQLQSRFGVAVEGTLLPDDVSRDPRVEGGFVAGTGAGTAAADRRFAGSLSGAGDEERHAYSPPDDAATLAVDLSGPDGADFDLYCTLDGRPPTRRDYDRRSHGVDADERVTVDADAAGDALGILVRSYRGSGEYELRVTVERD